MSNRATAKLKVANQLERAMRFKRLESLRDKARAGVSAERIAMRRNYWSSTLGDKYHQAPARVRNVLLLHFDNMSELRSTEDWLIRWAVPNAGALTVRQLRALVTDEEEAVLVGLA